MLPSESYLYLYHNHNYNQIALTNTLMTTKLCKQSLNFIIEQEVGSCQQFTEKYAWPVWPGAMSGVTIGIGYDLGYVTEHEYALNWVDRISGMQFEELRKVVGLKGEQAKQACKQLSKTKVSVESAMQVFEQTIVKYQKIAEEIFPGCHKLHPLAYGALVSLVYNRGGSLSNIDSRKQMINISRAFKGELQLEGTIEQYVAQQIRSMKRIWEGKNLGGLLKRRDKEADLVEHNQITQL